ncbi:glycosyltransferase family 2 protein [Pseudonocardia sp. KRD291]|uniref:glycosyltransferase family 2 protein n=1 Tax=Pseudonocardia sp. KRD291 TaxID=2792007 RepID=UPI001C4A0560|nr:glycosyltransferase family 2 protein [Pseudonocardia sp. KRD291]MBW0105265.1 glycosyltransferase family 2 protein [Pseudonocardia sp. KRD291]
MITEERPMLSVVVPIFNEEDVLPLFAERLRPILDSSGHSYEVIAVDDGSHDSTPILLNRLARSWPQVRVLRLRANAGHQAALSAGLTRATGSYVVSIDADLQDPPELIPDMLTAARQEAADVVYAVRVDRSTDTRFKRSTAGGFYRVMARISDNSGPIGAADFRLMSRATVDAVNSLPERHRVLRLIVPALGFPSTTVTYRRAERAAGHTKYPLSAMLRLTLDSITGFSVIPLRLATWSGLLSGAVAALLLLYAVGSFAVGRTVSGWASTFAVVAGVGAVQLLCLGLLGEYVGRMYSQMQGRPAYFVAYDSAHPDGPMDWDHDPAMRASPVGSPNT